MEIVEIHNTKKQQPKPQSKKTEVVVVNQVRKPGKNARKNAKRRQRKAALRQVSSRNSGASGYFEDHLLYPDILGPCRQPRFGSSARTGLAMNRAKHTIIGSTTNLVQGIQFSPTYGTIARSYIVTDNTTNLGAGSSVAPVVAWPPAVNIADMNLVASSMVISYIGNPLNVAGELLIGSSIAWSTTATYDTLYYYPNYIKVPIAELINKPLRVVGRKLSEAANEFQTTSVGIPDYECPGILTLGLPLNQQIVVEVTGCWEYRPTTASGVIPFDKTVSNSLETLNLFQQATSRIADMTAPVMDALPSFIGQAASRLLGGMTNLAATSVINMMSSRTVSRITSGTYRPRSYLGWRDEL